MKKYSLGALVAAGLLVGGLTAGSASAADLGGNCCADLEERIAELEATTARKGNRKVSLTISGWVGEQVMWWDDEDEQNTYVVGLGTTIGTHFKLTGQATISPGWSAGYVIHIEADGSDGLLGINQFRDDGPGVYTGSTNYVQLLQSFWFIKSDQLGKVSVGMQSQASDNTAILVDGSGSLIPANFVQFDYGGFFLKAGGFIVPNGFTGGPIPWIALTGCTDCNGLPLNSVRYDSPVFGGFSVSASWGEDDFWDVAARYAGEIGGFNVAVAAAYSESTDVGTQGVNPDFDFDGDGFIDVFAKEFFDETKFFQIGAYALHVPTGLFLYGASGRIQYEFGDLLAGAPWDDDSEFYYVKGGLREKWTPLGHTVVYGEYERFNDGLALGGGPFLVDFMGHNGGTALVTGSEVNLWGVGVVQEIDAAAMSLWLSYRRMDGEIDLDGGGTLSFDDFQYVKGGALINF
jgi:hypothetical protein